MDDDMSNVVGLDSKYLSPGCLLLLTCFHYSKLDLEELISLSQAYVRIHTRQSITTLWVDGHAHRTVAICKLKSYFLRA